MECLIEHAGALVDVDDHWGAPLTAEVALEESRQLTLSERHDTGVLPGGTTATRNINNPIVRVNNVM